MTQYGCTTATDMMYSRLTLRERKGLFFIHAITLCSDQEQLRKIADTDKYHPYTGGSLKMKKPCQIPKSNCILVNQLDPTDSRVAYLDENELVQYNTSSHVHKRDT